MYRDLLQMERKLDWTMTRKRVEVHDALQRIIPVSRHTGLSGVICGCGVEMRLGFWAGGTAYVDLAGLGCGG